MKHVIYFCLLSILIITSCAKEQLMVKKMDGTWIAKSVEKNGTKENYKYGPETKFEFSSCNESKEKCSGVYYIPKVCFECAYPNSTYPPTENCSSPEFATEIIEMYEQNGQICTITEENYYNNYFEFDMSHKGTTIEMYIYFSSGVFLYHGKVEDVEKNTMKLVLYPGDGNKLVYELEREK